MSPLTASPPARQAVVVGAGVVGTCCALSLLREGFRVTLIERDAPGEACSAGNAGRVAVGLCIPWSLPGLVWQVPGMLLDAGQPLKAGLLHMLRRLPWFVRFLRAGGAARAETIADALIALLAPGFQAYEALLTKEEMASLFRRDGYLYVYKSRASLAKTAFGFSLARRRGVPIEELDERRMREMEPALGPAAALAHYWPDESHTVNPLRVVKTLAERFVREGGRLARETARGFEFGAEAPHRVVTDAGSHPFDVAVLAAGAWSGPLARPLGYDPPLEAEYGFNIMLPEPGFGPKRPLNLVDRRLTITPMEEGLRITSGAYFFGLGGTDRWPRVDVVFDALREMFPRLETRGWKLWRGPRPSLPDSLPAIGPARRHPAVLFALGHGHIGLTTAAVTGRLIADLAAGRPPFVDLQPYRPDRFRSPCARG